MRAAGSRYAPPAASAGGADDPDLPGYRLHSLHGSLKGHYAVTVSGNWRVTFAFDRDKAAVDVDYLDYH